MEQPSDQNEFKPSRLSFFNEKREKANEKLSCTMMGCVLFPVLGFGLVSLLIIIRVVIGLAQLVIYHW